jgi:hypothetical protein
VLSCARFLSSDRNDMPGRPLRVGRPKLPLALGAAFVDKALTTSEGIAGLSVAMRGLIAARAAVTVAVAAIAVDIRVSAAR